MSALVILLMAGCDTRSLPPTNSTLGQLADLPEERLAKIDIALLNLKCAEELPGSEEMSISAALGKLDRWAERVRSETERYMPMYHQDPSKFRNMEGYFRMQMLVTVVMRDLGCTYNPARISDPENPEPASAFYRNAQDIFLNGFTDREPLGTCASFPVLYTALGRRLGYPLKLVTAKSHLFCRWDDGASGVCFNVEGTNSGMSSHPDSYYKRWPVAVSDDEIRENGHLESLSAKKEMAVFLSARGICWQIQGRMTEARQAYELASTLAPNVDFYQRLCDSVKSGPLPSVNQ